MGIKSKIYNLNSLAAKLADEKEKRQKIALANGGFDVIHAGHIRYLKAARDLADILVVAVNSDRSLRALKGKHRAKINEDGRAKILSSFFFVDYVIIFDELTVERVLLSLKPDYHCKGTDYTEETVPEKNIVESFGGKIVICGGGKIRSSSVIIKQIRKK